MRYIFLLIIIAVSVGAFFLIVKPKYDTLRETRGEVNSYDTSLETAEQLRISREELLVKYNAIPKTDLDSLKTLLPDAVDNIRLIIQLDSIATKNKMSTLRDIGYQGAEPQQNTPAQTSAADGSVGTVVSSLPYGEMTISFQTSGTYANFLAFLADLEHNLRLVDIVSIDFSGTEGQSGTDGQVLSDNLSYKLTLKTYWLKK